MPKTLTVEHRENIAASLRGKKHTTERRLNISLAHRGQIPWNKGKKTGKQPGWVVRKRSLSMLGKRSGSKNHFWKGGVTAINKSIRSSFEYRQWKIQVFLRDGRKCIICRSTENINADHIIPFSMTIRTFNIKSIEDARECTELWNIENGRTLCEPCHKKTITYGYNRYKLDTLAKNAKEIICQLSQLNRVSKI